MAAHPSRPIGLCRPSAQVSTQPGALQTTPSLAPRSPARRSASSSSQPAPNARKENGSASSQPKSSTTSTSNSPPKPSSPTAASSKTGSRSRARVPHRGAHLVGRQAAKQRGRRQPHPLRFSSRSPAPTPTLAKEPPAVQPLDFHP